MLVQGVKLSRRSTITVLLFGAFIGALLIASRRLTELCPDDGACYSLTRLREKLPSFRFPENKNQKLDGSCTGFPDTSNVLLIMKTGASESFARIPTQALTNLRCLHEYLVFSDMEQDIADIHIHDSLDTVLEEVKLGNQDFELYFRQQNCPIDSDACNKPFDTASEGWDLDKYKNTHMAEKTYKMRPNYDWYMFVDADTYVIWPTVMKWLEQLDPSDRHYLGSKTYVGDVPFGHGGSGYIVSRTVMQDLFEGKEGVANRYDQRTSKECCGDFIFGLALSTETGTVVNHTWPTINGEKPTTIWYGDEQWCQPLATMHHLGSEEISMFYEFERERSFGGPMRVKDVYHRFVEPHIKDHQQDWDNLSEDTWYMDTTPGKHNEDEIERAKTENLSALEEKAHLSIEDCRMACRYAVDCMQWQFRNGICKTAQSIKHGHPTKPSENQDERSTSGWNVERVRAWVRQHDDCGDVTWPVIGPAEVEG